MLGMDFAMLRAENTTPWVCSVLYKATVMAVILFGSETWNSAPTSLKHLKGFHHWAAWLMAGKGLWLNPDGSWTHPDTEMVMKEVGLQSLPHDVEVWMQHISMTLSVDLCLTCTWKEWGIDFDGQSTCRSRQQQGQKHRAMILLDSNSMGIYFVVEFI